ncbi:MAG: TetR/AcrR family transcriptional regulator [Gammaproteobacteria bacterium]|nr:TetR/AcrR family transcriptional regulator [Gammaproteobacteria bacterium]
MTVETVAKRRRGRPPKDHSAFGATRAALIRSGIELLTEKGFSATGIDEILRRVNVPKGSFYHYFGSKDAFGAELIDSYAAFFQHKLDKFLLDESHPPLDRLRAFIDDAIAGMRRYEFKRGCLVGNLGQEMGALPEPFRDRLLAAFNAWQNSVARCLELARHEGQVRNDIDCQQTAYVFWTGWEGAVLRAKLERSPTALTEFSSFFLGSLR